jgi:chemotaxis-related protein WspD
MNAECWNEIGIFGDSSCVELKQYHHCTHCPKYADGARKLLDQEPPDDYIFEWTAVLAREKETPRANTFSALLFRIGGSWLALPTSIFREVVEVRMVHKIPHRSNQKLLGLVNIRGTLHLCADLQNLLKLSADAPSQTKSERAYPRMVVVENENKTWAFTVDEILSLQRFAPEEIVPLPDVEKSTRGIVEWEGATFDVLDENLFFKRLEQILE